jgi:hypothetical protein
MILTMVGNLQPLERQFPIVDQDGRPTQYFIRWAQQRQIDIQQAVSPEEALAIAQAYVTDLLADNPLTGGVGIDLSPSGNILDGVTISANVQAILDVISSTQGAILFRGATDWQALAPGTAGQFLQTAGAGADPAWAAGGGGGGGGIQTLLNWDGAVDPAFSVSAALSLTGVRQLIVSFTDVTMASAGWRTTEFSFDGGATWEGPAVSLNYSGNVPATGVVGASGSGGDSVWFVHGTANAAARTATGVMYGLGFAGAKRYFSNRDSGFHLNRAIPTHVRVRGWLSNTTQANFTGGRIILLGYT